MCNNSPQCNKYQYKSMVQNGRINSPKLRPRLSSSEKPITINMSSCLEVEASKKPGDEGIMIVLIIATYIDFVI